MVEENAFYAFSKKVDMDTKLLQKLFGSALMKRIEFVAPACAHHVTGFGQTRSS